MSKILPVRYPYVRGLPDHAFYQSIIIKEEELNNWLSNSYIHVTCNENFVERKVLGFDFFVNYRECPYIDLSYVPSIVIPRDKIWESLCNLVDADYYIALFLDENIVPNRQFYKSGIVSYHNNLFYGYDDENAYLGCFDKNGKYIFEALNKKLFLDALVMNENRKFEVISKISNERYSVNVQFILHSLKEYLDGENIAERYSYKIPDNASPYKAYGWRVYLYMIEFYSSLAETGMDPDVRPLFMMIEHKKCMIRRLEMQSGGRELYDKVMYLMKKLDISLKYLLKYTLSKEKNNLIKLTDNLKECAELEKMLLKKIIAFYEGRV